MMFGDFADETDNANHVRPLGTKSVPTTLSTKRRGHTIGWSWRKIGSMESRIAYRARTGLGPPLQMLAHVNRTGRTSWSRCYRLTGGMEREVQPRDPVVTIGHCSTLYGEPATRDTPICALTPPGTPLAVYFTCQEAESLNCLLYTSPSPRDQRGSRMPSSA